MGRVTLASNFKCRMPRGRELRRLLSEWLTEQSFQIDEATAERDALVLPSKSRGAEIIKYHPWAAEAGVAG